jgi:hypothetical protein
MVSGRLVLSVRMLMADVFLDLAIGVMNPLSAEPPSQSLGKLPSSLP